TPKEAEFQVIGGKLPIETVYDFEPIPPQLKPEQHKHVLGTEGELWSEYIFNEPKLEYLAFPRACALAEVAWTPRNQKSRTDFMKRLEAHEKRLDAHQVNYRKADGSPAQPGQKIVNE